MSDALRAVVDEVVLALAPLVDAAGDDAALVGLLGELGWQPSAAPPPLRALAAAGSELVALIGAADVPLVQTIAAVARVVDALDTIRSQPDAAFPGGIDVAGFKSGIGRELLDHLLVDHLLRRCHRLGGVLRLAGLVRLVDTPAAGQRRRHLKRQVAWGQIGALLTDPAQGFRNAFGWGSATPDLAQALGVLGSTLESLGMQFSYVQPDGALLAFVAQGADGPGESVMGIDLAIDAGEPARPGLAAGVQLLLRPATAARGPAFALLPYADLGGALELDLGGGVTVSAQGDVDFTRGVALTLAPGRPIELAAGFLGGAAASPASLQLGVKIAAAPNEAERVLIGSAEASRLAMRSAAWSAGARLVSPGEIDAFVDLALDDAHIVIRPEPGEGDGFLDSLLGDEGLSATLSIGLRLSSRSGFHFRGSAGLQASFPMALRAGPVTLRGLSIALRPGEGGVALGVAASLAGAIGPVTVVVEGLGFELRARFPDPPTGNLGPLDLDIGFKPPSGIGLAVDAHGVVSGGGFLFHDAAQFLYAGVLQLSLHEVLTLKAYGLIATRMPDGTRGYSLLVFITAEDFRPIPLGLGFTLQGIGGMLAVHRSFDHEVLRAGLKDGSLAGLLFPRDPVGNAPALIRALALAFPARRGAYLLGLLVRIGWATPTLVRFDLALILEFGARKRLLVIGRISALLPSPDNDLVRLNLDALGVLDFDAGTAAIDAMLVDSRLAQRFVISGAMALRARWGSAAKTGPGPGFVLAIGGFHPRFSPPAGLPKLERLAIALSSGDNPRLSCAAYFAITSNTVQFGARAELYAGAHGFAVVGDIGYDVLIQIAPLHFIAEFHASLQLKRGSSNLFKVSLQGELEGPRPLRVSGKASFEILWCDFSVRFDKTLVDGEKPPLPPAVDVLQELTSALAAPTAWRTLAGQRHGVTLRKPSAQASAEAPVLDPLGRLAVSQQVVPLNRDIDRFGGAPPAGAKRFELGASLNGNAEATRVLQDEFAPAQYFELSDDDKLAAPSFERMDAGIEFGSEAIDFDAAQSIAAPLEYEQIVVDDLHAEPKPATRLPLEQSVLQRLSRTGAAARAEVRRAGRARFRSEDDATLAAMLKEPSYAVIPLTEGEPAAQALGFSASRARLAVLNRAGARWQTVPMFELVP